MAQKRKRRGSVSDAALVRAARAMLRRSHSRYSGTRVGAALLDREGNVHTGCNVENASYGLTLCAERVAVGKAVSEGAKRFEVIAIASNRDHALPPCGACRQTLREFGREMRVLLVGPEGVEETSLSALLPRSFGPGDLR